MRNVKRLGAVASALVLAVALTGPAGAADITVGEFVQQLARAKNLNATDAKIAADSLAAVGVLLPSDLDFGDVLTEGNVARIARSAGLNVRTGTPGSTFDSARSRRFFDAFSRELAGAPTSRNRSVIQARKGGHEDETPDAEMEVEQPTGKGKGKGKGKNGQTPTDPD